jgi:TolB protein
MRVVLMIGLTVVLAAVPAGAGDARTQAPWIAFRNLHMRGGSVVGPSRIALIRPGGTGLRFLTNGHQDQRPAFSPSGRLIAFSRTFPAGARIAVIGVDGRGYRALPSSRAADNEPSWSPSGRQLVVRGNSAGGGFDLYVINVSGRGRRVLLRTPRALERDPAWSPDGRRIAYTSDRSGQIQIWTLDLRSGRARQLTRGPAAFSPAWSPDGRRIAFARGGRIWVMNADGSRKHAIGSGVPRSAGDPAWSPDGRRIAFDRNYQVLSMFASGGGRRYVTRMTFGTNLEPSWQGG